MKFIYEYVLREKKLLLLAVVLATINQVFSLLDPQIFRWLIDNYIIKYKEFAATVFLKNIGLGLLAIVAVAWVSRIAKSFQDYYVNVMTEKIGMSIYQKAIRHIFDLPFKVFEDQQSWQLLQKMQKARQDIQKFINTAINDLFVSIIWLLFVITYAATVHRLVAISFISLIPIMGLTIRYTSKKIKEAQQKIVAESSKLAGSTIESIRNVALIKSLGLVQQEMGRLEKNNKDVLNLELLKVKMLRTLLFTQGTLINLVRTIIMGLMFWLVFKEAMTLGEFMTLFFYSFFVFGPLRQAGDIINNYQQAKGSHELLEEITKLPVEERAVHPLSIGWPTVTSLTFEQVDFLYQQDHTVLKDINLTIGGGQVIAFVWPSGSGKSTLLKLLYGLYEPNKGRVLINGQDMKHIDKDAFKAKLGIVNQDASVFSGSVRDNLSFVNQDATDQDLERVLKQAALRSLIEQNTEWLDTKIGEWGLKLSGWQRQRLAIARALLRNPDVLIFDEATSSLDSLVEKEITETIKAITDKYPDMISILVAHRLSTIMHADMIYVLEQGKIVEKGRHKDLVESNGLYHAMWRQQSGEVL